MLNEPDITILLAEDNPGHVRLIEKNLRRAKLSKNIIKFKDGKEIMNYVLSPRVFQSTPVLVLLDLNLPTMSGYQVLKRIKADKRTKHLPVVILTTSEDPEEISKCYNSGCNLYIIKPLEYDQFSEAIQNLGQFFSIVKFPKRGN